MCTVYVPLLTTVVYNRPTAVRTVLIIFSPDNHHSSDAACCREEGICWCKVL